MKNPALKIALIYFVFGLLWILITDTYFNEITLGRHDFLLAQNIKGIAFVILSALFLYLITYSITAKEIRAKAEYKRLFMESPNPMWVYDKDTLRILSANQSAVEQYGYEPDEFLSLRITDLVVEHQAREKEIEMVSGRHSKQIWLHKTREGKTYYCEVHGHSTTFRDRPANLILALNVDDKIRAEEKILIQNRQLKQIAQMQAHDIRGPLASIMGLISVLNKGSKDVQENTALLHNLEKACVELDDKIREIVRTTSEQ